MRALVHVTVGLMVCAAPMTANRPSAPANSVSRQDAAPYPADELLSVVHAAIRSKELEITEGASKVLRDFVENGRANYRADRHGEAVKNAQTLGNRVAEAVTTSKSSSVTEAMVRAVIAEVCPLFPFCK